MSEHISAVEAQALLDAATPGPWEVDAVSPAAPHWLADVYVCGDMIGEPVAQIMVLDHFDHETWNSRANANAELIAAAPRLAAEVVRLRRELDAVRELFAGGPDTSCRTTWRRTYQGGGTFKVSSPPVECVEVPLDDLRAVLGGGE